MLRFSVVCSLAFLVMSSSQPGVLVCAQEQKPKWDLDAIQQAWLQRQNKIRTFRISWKNRVTVRKGAFLDGRKDTKNPRGFVAPAETTTLEAELAMTMDGSKMRSRSESITVNNEGKLVALAGVSVRTASGIKGFNPKGVIEYPQGGVLPADSAGAAELAQSSIPPLVVFRPLTSSVPFLTNFMKRFQIEGGSVVEGRSCIHLKEIVANSALPATELWVDPLRDFVILRFTQSIRGKLLAQTTFHKVVQTGSGWLPLKWTRVDLRGGIDITTSTEAEVHEYELNVPIPEKEFELDFPPGTWVNDFSGGVLHRYIVREGRRKRPILEKELANGVSYEQLLTTEPGEALNDRSHGGSRQWIVLLLSVAVIAACLTALFRKRLARFPASG